MEILLLVAAFMLGLMIGWEAKDVKLERQERNRVWHPTNKRA